MWCAHVQRALSGPELGGKTASEWKSIACVDLVGEDKDKERSRMSCGAFMDSDCTWGLPKIVLNSIMLSNFVAYIEELQQICYFLLRWWHIYFSETPSISIHSTNFQRIKLYIKDDGLGGKYQQRCASKSFLVVRDEDNWSFSLFCGRGCWVPIQYSLFPLLLLAKL